MRSFAGIIGARSLSSKHSEDGVAAGEGPARRGAPGRIALGGLAFATLLGAATGCPKPAQRFEEFVERTAKIDMAMDVPDAAPSMIFDINGQFLLSLGNVVVNQDARIQFIADVVLADQGDGTALMDLSIRPINFMTRVALPDPPIVVRGNVVNPDGTFRVPLGRVMVSGEANAISGSPITADLTLLGTIRSADRFCGGIEGMAISPLMISLNDALWSGVRITPGTMGMALPAPDISCMAGPAPDGGAGDAAVSDSGADAAATDAAATDASMTDAAGADAALDLANGG